MLKFSRRPLLVGTAVLMIARAAFDLHPRFDDTELGRDVTDEMVAHLLESVHPFK